MLLQNDKPAKKINVNARGGVSRKIGGTFTYDELKKATPRDLLDQIIERNIKSTNIIEQKTAEAIKHIVEDSMSDIDVKLYSSDPGNSQHGSRSRQPEQDKMEEFIKKAEMDEEKIEEIQISAATMANGGSGAAL
jgi:hypothetical protein